MYHITFVNDPKTLKATIYFTYLTETVYTAVLAYHLTFLTINPRYKGYFVYVVIPVCGGLGALHLF